jgi:hypothetical protein
LPFPFAWIFLDFLFRIRTFQGVTGLERRQNISAPLRRD